MSWYSIYDKSRAHANQLHSSTIPYWTCGPSSRSLSLSFFDHHHVPSERPRCAVYNESVSRGVMI